MEKDGVKALHAADRAAWRAWLEEHHATEKSVWLILYKKKSGVASVTYDEAVDEALCFGWIDSKPNKRDADSSYQFFAQRKPKSNWSRVNKNKIDKLTAEGRMAPAGLAAVALARDTGAWNALDEVEDLIVPPDLQALLDENPVARDYFDRFPRSAKRGILEWILNAKTAPTREKRLRETVDKASRNERANQYVPKDKRPPE